MAGFEVSPEGVTHYWEVGRLSRCDPKVWAHWQMGERRGSMAGPVCAERFKYVSLRRCVFGGGKAGRSNFHLPLYSTGSLA